MEKAFEYLTICVRALEQKDRTTIFEAKFLTTPLSNKRARSKRTEYIYTAYAIVYNHRLASLAVIDPKLRQRPTQTKKETRRETFLTSITIDKWKNTVSPASPIQITWINDTIRTMKRPEHRARSHEKGNNVAIYVRGNTSSERTHHRR